tara:strand:- start:2987 stop:3466 length:480 start_codon:yes stop_codon:yes gene_type:complete
MRRLKTNTVKLKKKSTYYVIYYNYTEISKFLFKFTETFSTSNKKSVTLLEFINNLEKEEIHEFLKTFWDDEGCVKVCKDITAKTKSENVAQNISKLHKKVGIKTNVYRDSKNNAYEIYLIRNKDNISEFKDKVGFQYGVISRGNFKGLSKSQGLDIITV